MQNFRDLTVWQKSHALTKDLYEASRAFPRDERYGLTAQMRRAAVSIGADIAEGCGRNTRPDFARFLHIALGSASELEYLVLLTRDIDVLDSASHDRLTDQVTEIKRMLTSLAKKLKTDD